MGPVPIPRSRTANDFQESREQVTIDVPKPMPRFHSVENLAAPRTKERLGSGSQDTNDIPSDSTGALHPKPQPRAAPRREVQSCVDINRLEAVISRGAPPPIPAFKPSQNTSAELTNVKTLLSAKQEKGAPPPVPTRTTNPEPLVNNSAPQRPSRRNDGEHVKKTANAEHPTNIAKPPVPNRQSLVGSENAPTSAMNSTPVQSAMNSTPPVPNRQEGPASPEPSGLGSPGMSPPPTPPGSWNVPDFSPPPMPTFSECPTEPPPPPPRRDSIPNMEENNTESPTKRGTPPLPPVPNMRSEPGTTAPLVPSRPKRSIPPPVVYK